MKQYEEIKEEIKGRRDNMERSNIWAQNKEIPRPNYSGSRQPRHITQTRELIRNQTSPN